MDRLPFVLWMLLFPVTSQLECWMSVQAGTHLPHDPDTAGVLAIIMLAIWFGVGALAYRRKP